MADQFPAPTKMVLSPAAQAIWDAFNATAERVGTFEDYGDALAAALRAAADQVVPGDEEPIEPPGYGIGCGPPGYLADWTQWRIRRKFLALATELEAQ